MTAIKNWALTLITILAVGFSLSSCDDDAYQANYLEGRWRGDFGMYYIDKYYHNKYYAVSTVEFYQSGYSNHGYGKQYDYYASGPIEWEYFTFDWEIQNGVIYIDYPYNPELNTVIYDYRMTNSYFSGYFQNSGASFRLNKWNDWNWSGYNGNYDYYYRYDYYYAKTRANATDSISNAPQEDDSCPVLKRGNRFNEK